MIGVVDLVGMREWRWPGDGSAPTVPVITPAELSDNRSPAREADPCLLEPIMRLDVTCPEELFGAVVGDVTRRCGSVRGLDAGHGGEGGVLRIVHAEVPLAETFGYAGALSALTHGRGRLTLEPAHYEQVPDSLARAIGA